MGQDAAPKTQSLMKETSSSDNNDLFYRNEPAAPVPTPTIDAVPNGDDVEALPGCEPLTATWLIENICNAEQTYFCLMGLAVWAVVVYVDHLYKDKSVHTPIPRSVEVTYSFCGTAYAACGLLGFLKLLFERNVMRLRLHIVSIYISLIASSTYCLLALQVLTIEHDMKSVLWLPSRWILYVVTMPTIWWILSHISSYNLQQKLYVFWLNWVMLVAGGLATIPWISWGHKVYWMLISCVPFPELCFHMWQMITDAMNAVDTEYYSLSTLQFVRVYGQFSYQFFPAIYFVAFDGCLPLDIVEPLWSTCDWCLKMVMSSSLVEANFVSIEQRRSRMEADSRERENRENIVKLVYAITAKDNFLAAISHELCTPLNGIIGLSDALLANEMVAQTPSLTKTVKVMSLSGRRLLQLIYDILDAAKMRQGTITIKHEEVDISSLVMDVAMLSSNLVHTGVVFRLSAAPVPKIIGDTGRIVQVLYNLVGNACKFTRRGSVRLSVAYDASIGAVAVEVSDTGCGISLEKIDLIFNAYERGGDAMARSFAGNGLGLHLVKQLVRAHCGVIEVDSTPNVGSTFTVWFPAYPDERLYTGDPDGSKTIRVVRRENRVTERTIGSPGVAVSVDGWAARNSSERTRPGREPQGPLSSHLSGNLGTLSSQPSEHLTEGPAGARGLIEAPASPDELVTGLVRPIYHGEVHMNPQLLLVTVDPDAERAFECLINDGFTMAVVSTGKAALDTLITAPLLPDAIFVFDNPSDTSAIDFITRLQHLFALYAIPVFMLSSDNSREQLQACLNAGYMDFVHWPIYPMELYWRVKNKLSARSFLQHTLLAQARGVLPDAMLHPFLVSLLPYYHRHRLGQNVSYDGTSPIVRRYVYTAVVHVAMKMPEQSDMEPDSWEQLTSVIHQVHVIVHNVLRKSQLVPINDLPHGWTFFFDTDAQPRALSLSQAASELTFQLQYLREIQSLSIDTRIGIAYGPLTTVLSSARTGTQLTGAGPVLRMARAIAHATALDTIGLHCSSVYEETALAGSAADVQVLTLPGPVSSVVRFRQLTAQEMITQLHLAQEQVLALQKEDPIFAALAAVQANVRNMLTAYDSSRSDVSLSHATLDRATYSSFERASGANSERSSFALLERPGAAAASAARSAARNGSSAATTAIIDSAAMSGGFSGILRSGAFSASNKSSTTYSFQPGKAVSSGRRSSLQNSDLRNSLQDVEGVLARARGALEAAVASGSPPLPLPPLAKVADEGGVSLSWQLSTLAPTVAVMAFVPMDDMGALGLPGGAGIKLLTLCKRAFTDMLLRLSADDVNGGAAEAAAPA